jgi:hypothetical protein
VSPKASTGAKPATTGPSGKIGIIVLGIVIVALAVAVFDLPRYVKQKCIDAAAAEGVSITIGSAQIGWGEVHLTEVGFKIDDVPQITGIASDVDVTLSGFTPETLAARGVGITIDGPSEEISAAVDQWRAHHAKAPGRAAATLAEKQKVTMQSGHVAWTRAFGQVAKIDASNVTADTDANGSAFHLAAEKTNVTTPKGELGPWRVTFERDAEAERTRIDLDPALRDGPSALYVKAKAGGVSLKVNIPKSPLSRVGLPPAVLGLPAGQATLVMATIDLERKSTTLAEMKSQVALFGARLGGAPVPVDVHLDFVAAGDPAKPLDVSHGTLTVGPFHANVVGTMQLFPDGTRLSLAWRAQPLKCEALAQNAAKEALGDFGAQLSEFAKGLGVAKVTGEAHVSGFLTIDSRNLNDVSVTMTAKESCGIAIFP